MEGRRLAIELRNRGWVTGDALHETQEYFREHQVSFVVVDAPDTEHFMSMPTVELVTTPELAYYRLHGRNVQGYVRGRTVATRFNYLYSDEELEEIAAKVEDLAQQAAETHIVYNNNASDYAIRSAKRFQEIISHSPAMQK